MGAILLGIAMFMFLVLIHELGHFLAAKKSGVKVEEFGIGIPPKVGTLWTDKQGTEYTINWIPLGGFVRLKGENPDDEETFHAKDSFIRAKFWNKILILIAGVAVNSVFAWLAFSVAFMQGVYPLTVVPDNMLAIENTSYLMPTYSFLQEKGFIDADSKASGVSVVIDSFLEDSLAEQAGLQLGDTILEIDGNAVSARSISRVLQQSIGERIVLTVQREGERVDFPFQCGEESCFLGVVMQSADYNVEPIQFGFGQSLVAGGHEMRAQTRLTFHALGNLFGSLFSFNSKRISSSVDKLSGPVGIVKFGEHVWQLGGRVSYLAFAGLISLALAVFNILPIPALDGGRMLGVIIQKLGRFKEESYYTIENYINVIFFILLMILGVYIIFKDLSRFWGVSIPFF